MQAENNKQVTLYFCMISPYTYIGYKDFLSLCSRNGLSINLKPLNLRELFARTGGVLPKARHISRQNYRKIELLRSADLQDIKINIEPRYWPYDYTIVDKMVISSILSKVDFASILDFISKGLTACWRDEKNMADKSFLIKLANDCSLDGEKLYNSIEEQEIVSQYQANQDEAVEKSIFGVPCFEYQGEIFWGQDRLSHLEKMIQQGRKPIIIQP